jgi:hypothetical protein
MRFAGTVRRFIGRARRTGSISMELKNCGRQLPRFASGAACAGNMVRMVRRHPPRGWEESASEGGERGAIPSSPPFSGQFLICSGDWPPGRSTTLSTCPGRDLPYFHDPVASPQDPSAIPDWSGVMVSSAATCGIRALLFAFSIFAFAVKRGVWTGPAYSLAGRLLLCSACRQQAGHSPPPPRVDFRWSGAVLSRPIFGRWKSEIDSLPRSPMRGGARAARMIVPQPTFQNWNRIVRPFDQRQDARGHATPDPHA